MTPKEKAEELVIKFYDTFTISWEYDNWVMARECALIAVDEVLKTNTLENRNCGFITLCEKHKEYWQEVKQEIELL